MALILSFFSLHVLWSPLWSSGQSSSWGSVSDSWIYKTASEVVGLERSLLGLLRTIEKLCKIWGFHGGD
jgi:hypothetical protein